jgi:hypothetical protein
MERRTTPAQNNHGAVSATITAVQTTGTVNAYVGTCTMALARSSPRTSPRPQSELTHHPDRRYPRVRPTPAPRRGAKPGHPHQVDGHEETDDDRHSHRPRASHRAVRAARRESTAAAAFTILGTVAAVLTQFVIPALPCPTGTC